MKICPRCNTKYDDKANVCNHDGVKLETLPEMAKTSDANDQLIGKVIAGRFKILSKLGQGGMGAVYKAEQVRMSRICAIKVIPQEMAQDRDAIERFDREAKMSALINDQHAVTVYDFGEAEDGIYFLAMEYVEGETLSNILRREGVLPLARIVNIVRQAGQALNAAHQQNIVHRDLKPDNIMIARKDGNDWVKVLDFGIAKISAEDRRNDLTRAGMVVGTPLYMSPEQLSGEKLDPRSDIYSFALIVYQMMTGGLPFQGDNAQALMVKRLTDNPLPMKSVNPRVNLLPSVEAIVLAALARDRRNRTQSIRHFVEQLEEAAKADPSTARTLINSTAQNKPAPATGQNQMGGTAGGGGYYTPSQNPHSGSQPGVSSKPQGAALSTPTPPGSMPPYGQPQTPPQSMPQMKQPSGQQYYQQMPPSPTPPNPGQPMVGGVQTPRQPTPGQPMPMPFPTPPGVQPPVQPQKKSRAGLWISLILVFFVVVIGSCAVIIYTISDNTTVNNNGNNSSNNGETQKQTGNGSDYVDNTDSQTVDIDKNSSGSATALEHYNKGVTLLDEKDYNSAAAEFKLALQLQSDYREAQENLAIALYYASQYKEAIKEARRAIEVYGGSRAQSYEVLGRAQYDDRQYMQAAQSFLQAASLDPNNLEVRVLAAFALDLAGQSATANQMYDNFIENYPTHYLATQINNIKQGDRPPAVLPKP